MARSIHKATIPSLKLYARKPQKVIPLSNINNIYSPIACVAMKNKKSPTKSFLQDLIIFVFIILVFSFFCTCIKGKTILEFIDNIVNNWPLYCQTIFLAGTFGYSIASFREKSDEERNESRRNTIKTNFFNMVNYHYRMLDDLEVKPLRKKQENDSEKETTQERQPDS